MIKCKTALEFESVCGKDICCCECDLKDTCEIVCETNWEDCKEAIKEENLPATFESKGALIIQAITDIIVQKQKLDEQEKQMREQLVKAMEEYSVKKFENGKVSLTYKEPSVRKTFDKKLLAAAHPEINLADYEKTSNVSASVVIKLLA